jgi:hypothetical protein
MSVRISALKLRLAALAVIALLAVVATLTQPRAQAFHDPFDACSGDIANAVAQVNGISSSSVHGNVCAASLYGTWNGNTTTLQQNVANVMDTCSGHRLLTQALIEYTGAVPVNHACNATIYQNYISANIGGSPTIDWTNYDQTAAIGTVNTYDAVGDVLSLCNDKMITMAVLDETNQLPYRAEGVARPYGATQGTSGSGQCNRGLYDQGVFYSYDSLRFFLDQRRDSTTTCSDPNVTQAYLDLTGWKPNPAVWTPGGTTESECNIARYHNGSWSSYDELKSLVFASTRCRDPWVGEAYVETEANGGLHIDHPPAGTGVTGYCNQRLYSGGQYSSFSDLGSGEGTAIADLSSANWNFSSDGELSTPGGYVDANNVRIYAPDLDEVSTGNGNLISRDTAGLISDGGGSVVGVGSGAVVGVGAGNVVPKNSSTIASPPSGGIQAGGNAGNVVGVGAGG